MHTTSDGRVALLMPICPPDHDKPTGRERFQELARQWVQPE